MDNNELLNDVKDLIVRVEGTLAVLRRPYGGPDVLRADRKLQGLRDKLKHMLFKLSREKSNDTLVSQLQRLDRLCE